MQGVPQGPGRLPVSAHLLCYLKMQQKHVQRLFQHQVVDSEPFSEPINGPGAFRKGSVCLGQFQAREISCSP